MAFTYIFQDAFSSGYNESAFQVQTARLEAEIELLSQDSEGGGLRAASPKHKTASSGKKAAGQHSKVALPSDLESSSRTQLPPPLSIDVSEQKVTDCSGVSQREKSQAHSNDGASRVTPGAHPKSMVHCDSL